MASRRGGYFHRLNQQGGDRFPYIQEVNEGSVSVVDTRPQYRCNKTPLFRLNNSLFHFTVSKKDIFAILHVFFLEAM
jgi:hypothetical protein